MRWVAASAARLALVALVAGGGVRCKGADVGQIAAAAITVSAAVAAAAINRAATDECWGNCPPGTYCDEGSGMCLVPDEDWSAAPSDDEVLWVACDGAQFECGANQWLRCEAGCEWVMCDEDEAAPNPAEPERCCHQACAWLDCFEDGRPCETAGTVPPRIRSNTRTAATDAPAAPPGFVAGSPTAPVDPCRGLCVSAERCEVRDGIADCIANAP